MGKSEAIHYVACMFFSMERIAFLFKKRRISVTILCQSGAMVISLCTMVMTNLL